MRTIKKEQIIQEAIRLFAQFGYKKTTLDDIAKSMGMTRGNIYHYVENKEDLYSQAINVIIQEWKDEIEEKTAIESNSLDRVRTLLFESINYPKNQPYFADLILDDPCLLPNIYTYQKRNDFHNVAEEILKEYLYDGIYRGLLREVDVDQTVEYIISMHIVYLYKIYSKEYDEKALKEYYLSVDLIYHGLKAK